MTNPPQDHDPNDIQQLPYKEQVELINSRLEFFYQADINQSKILQDEKYIVEDEKFQAAVQKARDALRLQDKFLDLTEYRTSTKSNVSAHWLMEHLAGRDIKLDFRDYKNANYHYWEEVYDAIETALHDADLTLGWFDYMLAYISLGKRPPLAEIEPETPFAVTGIDVMSIAIAFKKGALKASDLQTLWKALKPFFEEEWLSPASDSLKNKIYIDHQQGLSVGKIAKKYFAREYKIDSIATRDKVKKIIKRFKK